MAGEGSLLHLESLNMLCVVLIGCFSNKLIPWKLRPVLRNLCFHQAKSLPVLLMCLLLKLQILNQE